MAEEQTTKKVDEAKQTTPVVKEAESKPKATPRKVRKIAARVVARDGASEMVEVYAKNDCQRRIVPGGSCVDDTVPSDVWEAGVEVGVAWEDIIQITATPATIAATLRRHRIFTAEDLQADAARFMGAWAEAFGADMQTLKRKAAEIAAE